MFLEDTIVAPATNLSKQAISIIRISGKEAFNIVNKLLKKPLIEKNVQQLRKIYDNNQLIDESLILTFVENNSFTGENVVEINCHGGVLLTNKILQLLIFNGARLANPGEFSQRAYLNGRINLLQAESINNLIEAKNNLSIKLNAIGVVGKNNDKVIIIKEKILDMISRIQTSIDYPDYDDIEGSSSEEILKSLKETFNLIAEILKVSKRATFINQGIKTTIIGEPNVGKSSLLNALLNEDKAIVTNIEGTTRDIVEGEISFDNFSLKISDTAGIRKTNDQVESIGIEKSLNQIKESDLILYVIDKPVINQTIFKKIKSKKYLIVLNKADILSKEEIKKVFLQDKHIICVSAKNKEVNKLIEKIQSLYNNEDLLVADLPILTNINDITNLEIALNLINSSIKNLENGFDFDILSIDLYKSLEIINNLLGIIEMDEEVINNIFKKYCLGK
ncbi:tRNA uridine-5-carboxymethylaminomethyl(34) synthesis GTPase MnmE [Spiroplasma gladiatoris]|uniref:tRNA uridine-5-carboxymethylaminomethyl(34) synthesis GTPase MnmE n=1 Tax=Spiroplasma gladiatoris TaxID=2143 RepID=UPI0010678E32